MRISTLAAVWLAASLGLASCQATAPSQGRPIGTSGSLAAPMEDGAGYALLSTSGPTTPRPIALTVFEETAFGYPAFKICTRCMCLTGLFTEPLPELGIRPTSASPTFACEDDETARDAESAAHFLSMTRAMVSDGVVTAQAADGGSMVFRLGGS